MLQGADQRLDVPDQATIREWVIERRLVNATPVVLRDPFVQPDQLCIANHPAERPPQRVDGCAARELGQSGLRQEGDSVKCLARVEFGAC